MCRTPPLPPALLYVFVGVQHEVASLVYVKSGGMELGDTAAFPNGANGRAGCNMWRSLYNFPFHFKQVKLFQINSNLSNFIVLQINYAVDKNEYIYFFPSAILLCSCCEAKYCKVHWYDVDAY